LTGLGEGFGAIIGMGSQRMCEKYGHPELSMTSKGQEFPAYDGRAIQGIGLGYATSNRGGCHLRGYTIASEVLGIPIKTDPADSDGKADLLKAFQDATAAFDSAGICIFTSFAWTLENVAPQLDAACEGDWTPERLAELGERVYNLEREFNYAAGQTGADDALPPRLTKEPVKQGPMKGQVNELGKMLPEYYAARGWNADGTIPQETKDRLGL